MVPRRILSRACSVSSLGVSAPGGASVPSRPSNHSVLAALRGPDPLGSPGPSRREIGGRRTRRSRPCPAVSRVVGGSSTVLPPHTEGVAGSGLVFIATPDRDLARPGGGRGGGGGVERTLTQGGTTHPTAKRGYRLRWVVLADWPGASVYTRLKGHLGRPAESPQPTPSGLPAHPDNPPGLGPRTGCRDLSGRITPREDAGYSQRLRGSWRAAGDR